MTKMPNRNDSGGESFMLVPWFKTWSASLLEQNIMVAGAVESWPSFLSGQKQRTEDYRRGQSDT